jgi:protein phosphatase
MIGDSHIGKRRKINQDSIFYDAKLGLGVVCDGIGGRAAGEKASSLVVDFLQHSYRQSTKIGQADTTPYLIDTINQANLTLIERSRTDEALLGMGSTVNCLAFKGDKLFIGHVGDSRTYLYHKGHMFQLTMDHSVEEFTKRGWLSQAVLNRNPKKGALVRAIGLFQNLDVDVIEIRLREKFIFLTCSDGLSGMVSDQRILELMRKHENELEKLPDVLIKEANKMGGGDNITVLLSQVE